MSLGIQTISPAFPHDPVLRNWREQVRSATGRGTPLAITGAGSKWFYGRPVAGETLDTREYAGIVDYEPTELLITARCGTPLAEIDDTLAGHGQMLAFEPPRFGGSPTVGGMVASGLSGPRRMNAGAVRDYVLGVRLLNGNGDLLSFGGRVMKNVAGYDVSRLLAGSLGCLGVIAEVSLKVMPRPRRETTIRFELSQQDALDRLNRWAGLPLPISASTWFDGTLCLRLSGAEPAVEAAQRKLGGEPLDDASAMTLWEGLRDQTSAFFAPREKALVRLSLPGTAPPLALVEPQLLEWGGAQRWCHADVDRLQEIRDLAARAGGHATLFRAPSGVPVHDVFTPLPPPLLRIHRSLKQAFDPAGVFNRGRMYQEF